MQILHPTVQGVVLAPVKEQVRLSFEVIVKFKRRGNSSVGPNLITCFVIQLYWFSIFCQSDVEDFYNSSTLCSLIVWIVWSYVVAPT